MKKQNQKQLKINYTAAKIMRLKLEIGRIAYEITKALKEVMRLQNKLNNLFVKYQKEVRK